MRSALLKSPGSHLGLVTDCDISLTEPTPLGPSFLFGPGYSWKWRLHEECSGKGSVRSSELCLRVKSSQRFHRAVFRLGIHHCSGHCCQGHRWGLGYWSGEAWPLALTFQEEGAEFWGNRTFSWQRRDAEKSWTTVIVEASAQMLCIAALTFYHCRRACHGSGYLGSCGNKLGCSVSHWERGGVNNCEW